MKTFQVRKNTGKRRVATLAPLGVLESFANASEVGLPKYWENGYRENGGYSLSQCLDSAVRHIMLRTGGEKYDPEGSAYIGRPIDHIDMACWNIGVACEMLRLYGPPNDDLWYGPGSATRKATDRSESRALLQLQANIQKLKAQIEKKGRRETDKILFEHIESYLPQLEASILEIQKEEGEKK